MTRRDAAWALVFFLAGLVLRIPFRSELAYHWDGAQFALAINEYSVALSQPHAPGYLGFVVLGRLVHGIFGIEPHASLVWVCVVCGALLPALLLVLGMRLFNRTVGLVAGGLALTSPQVWFHSAIAVTYVVDAVLVGLTVWAAWRAIERAVPWREALLLGGLLAVVGSVRQQTVPLLLPLVLYALAHARAHRVVKVLAAGAVAVLLALVWFWPTVTTAGGLEVYLEIVRRHGINNSVVTFAGGGVDALLNNIAAVGAYCWNGLMLGLVVLFAALVYRAMLLSADRRQGWWQRQRRAMLVLVWWLVPMVLWGTVIGFTSQPGYVLGYLPALFLLVAVAVAELANPWRRLVTALLIAANVWAFAAWPAAWDGILLGVGRTAREIRQHDRQLGKAIAFLRAHYRPDEVVLMHANGWFLWGIRHFQLHAPEFEGYQLSDDFTVPQPPGRRIWRVAEGHLTFAGRLNEGDKPRVLLVVPPSMDLAIFAPHFPLHQVRAVDGADGAFYELIKPTP